MILHLRHIKGINKVLEELKKLDKDIVIKDYGKTFYDIDSKTLKALVHYDYCLAKQVLWVYDNEWGKSTNVGHETNIPIRFIDLFGGK